MREESGFTWQLVFLLDFYLSKISFDVIQLPEKTIDDGVHVLGTVVIARNWVNNSERVLGSFYIFNKFY